MRLRGRATVPKAELLAEQLPPGPLSIDNDFDVHPAQLAVGDSHALALTATER